MIFRNHDDAIDSAQVIRLRFDSSTCAAIHPTDHPMERPKTVKHICISLLS